MFRYTDNELIKGQVIIFDQYIIIAYLEKANFESDEDCNEMASKICKGLNK